MKMRRIRMPNKMWNSIPECNRSEWIRIAIKMRLARDEHGLKDEYMEALNNSSTQVLRVGITLNQMARKLNSQSSTSYELPIREITHSIKACMKDLKVLKELYRHED